MKERPIIFNAADVNAILSGRKTQTRRVMKDQPEVIPPEDECGSPGYWIPCHAARAMVRNDMMTTACPFGMRGDRLWVRESYRMPESLDRYSPRQVAELALESGYRKPWAPIQLEADGVSTGKWNGFDTPPMVTEPGKLRPSLHMPRWASRITLEITGVRVERLNSISQEDAQAEGFKLSGWVPSYSNPDNAGFDETLTPYDNFAEAWESIYGQRSWLLNPWVWVIEFKRIVAGGN